MVSLTITKSLNSGCLVMWKIIQKVKAYFLCHLSIYRGNGLCRWKMKRLMVAPTIHMTPTMTKINEYGKAEGHKITRFLWDGNVPLHEWSYPLSDRPETIDDSDGRRTYLTPEPQTKLTTWIFDEGTFVPSAKIVGERRYSIISDYLGTPIEAYDEDGQRVWARELDVYGRVRIEQGEVGLVPFLYQGQYLDTETGLAYNRFRYYSPETGAYISQDPIRLEAGLTNLYAYVHDVNAWIDPWGLAGTGGAYMFGFASGHKYIGKGEIGRMNKSIGERSLQVPKMNMDSTLIGAAHVSTGGE